MKRAAVYTQVYVGLGRFCWKFNHA